ncbi:MAG: hypothetical protein WAO76_00440 [Georgfuchsia sp.]
MTTTNLLLPEITEAQFSKYLIHNQALAILDAAAGQLTHNMASDANYTLSTATTPQQWQYGVIEITDTGPVLTTGRSIIVPLRKKQYTLVNATAQTLTMIGSTGTGIAVATGKTAILRCDGVNVLRVTADL